MTKRRFVRIVLLLFGASLLLGAALLYRQYSDPTAPESLFTRGFYSVSAFAESEWDYLLYRRLGFGAKNGAAAYAQSCAPCHGLHGDDGHAPNLAVRVLPHARTDADLLRIIRQGIPGTNMPGTVADSREGWQIAAHVRRLGKTQPATPAPVTGAVSHGRTVAERNCFGCHTVQRGGNPVGPDLSAVGNKLSPAALRSILLKPPPASPAYTHTTIEVKSIDGKDKRTITGLIANEDQFSVQVRDLGGRLHSIMKDEILSRADPSTSLMPSYSNVLSASDLDDLVAFLASLRGR
jgi:putative heme-binding domain-containing protein